MSLSSSFHRHPIAALLVAAVFALAPRSAAAVDPSYSGSWYNPPESGSGFNLEIFSDERALLFWYTYDDFGDPVWLYSEGVIDGETIDFDVFYADGMFFSDLDTADKVNRPWGTLTMTFLGCDNATISYQSTLTGINHSPVGTRTLPVERLVNIHTLPCRRPASGYWEGRQFDPTLDGGQGDWADVRGVLTEDGRLFFDSDASEEVFVGQYAATGDTLAFGYEGCEEDGSPCYDAQGTATFASKDFITGQSTSVPYGTQPVELSYRTIYDRDVPLLSLAGTYSLVDAGITYTLTVGENGAVQGTDSSGCVYTGDLTKPDPEFNLFEYAGLVSGCRTDAWNGVVINTDLVPGDGRRLEFYVESNSTPVAFIVSR